MQSSKFLLLTCMLSFLLTGVLYAETKPYYSGAKEGWWWYQWNNKEEEKEKKAEKKIEKKELPSLSNYSYDDLWKMHPDDFQALLQQFLKKAVMTLQPEHVKEYLIVQDIARRKSLGFTNVAAYIQQKHPELSLEQDMPITTPGQNVLVRLREQEKEDTIRNAKDDFALLYFYSPMCPYCKAQDEILAFFSNKYSNWVIKRVNIDENPFLRSRFNITTVPALMLVYKGSGDYIHVSTGVMSLVDIETNLYRAIRLLRGEITPEEYSLYRFEKQKGSGFSVAPPPIPKGGKR